MHAIFLYRWNKQEIIYNTDILWPTAGFQERKCPDTLPSNMLLLFLRWITLVVNNIVGTDHDKFYYCFPCQMLCMESCTNYRTVLQYRGTRMNTWHLIDDLNMSALSIPRSRLPSGAVVLNKADIIHTWRDTLYQLFPIKKKHIIAIAIMKMHTVDRYSYFGWFL